MAGQEAKGIVYLRPKGLLKLVFAAQRTFQAVSYQDGFFRVVLVLKLFFNYPTTDHWPGKIGFFGSPATFKARLGMLFFAPGGAVHVSG